MPVTRRKSNDELIAKKIDAIEADPFAEDSVELERSVAA
jgi:hypothetical protein